MTEMPRILAIMPLQIEIQTYIQMINSLKLDGGIWKLIPWALIQYKDVILPV